MAKFRFRLATLRKLRVAHRDEMRGKLAEAYQAALMLQEQQVAIGEELLSMQATQRENTSRGTTNVNSLLEAQRYQAVLRAQQATLKEQETVLSAEIERRRQNAVEADRQVRVLDKLHDHQREQHQQEASRLETKVLDEVALRAKEVNQS